MRGQKAVVCPACGAINRPTWEFCARCNESLEGVTATEAASAAQEGPEEVQPEGPGSANAVLFAAVLAVILLAAVGWRTVSRASNEPPAGAAFFTMGTTPPALPSPAPRSGATALYEDGLRALRAGDLPTAIAQLQEASSAEPGNAEYKLAYSRALWRSDDREGAVAAIAEAAALDPRLQVLHARSLDVAGRSEEAVKEYEAILERSPQAGTLREDLGRLLFRTGDYGRAAAHLQAAVAARPDDPVLQQELAYSLDQSGDRVQAAAVYRAVLEQAPDAVISRGLLAETLVDQGKKDEALALLQEGVRRRPEAPLLQRQMGSVLERSGRPLDAAAAYRNYATLAPNSADAKALVERAARLEAAAGGTR